MCVMTCGSCRQPWSYDVQGCAFPFSSPPAPTDQPRTVPGGGMLYFWQAGLHQTGNPGGDMDLHSTKHHQQHIVGEAHNCASTSTQLKPPIAFALPTSHPAPSLYIPPLDHRRHIPLAAIAKTRLVCKLAQFGMPEGVRNVKNALTVLRFRPSAFPMGRLDAVFR